MKKSSAIIKSILLFTVLICFNCNNQETDKGYTITGSVKGAGDGTWVKLMNAPTLLTDPLTVLDSTQIANGKFIFKGHVDNVDRVWVKIGSNSDVYFFLENSKISIELDVANSNRNNGYNPAKISGSKTHALFELQREKLDSIKAKEKYNAFKGFREEVMAAKRSKDSTLMARVQQKMADLEGLEKEQQLELKEYKLQFLKDNPSSPVGPAIMGISFSEIYMSREEMTEVYKIFQGDARKSGKFRFLTKTYKDYVEKYAPGAIAPDFTLKTLDGSNITLSNIKADYILVDFWASWCVPCRASFPKLKKVYETYRDDGFEVVAVATGDKDDKWREAIIKDQTPWVHVFDVNEKTIGRNGDVADAYGVPFLPTTYLLDSNLKIILRNPKKEELDAKLIELFKS